MGCTEPSDISWPPIIYGTPPQRGPDFVKIGEETNRNNITLFWETIP
jgi:hypothetical protein